MFKIGGRASKAVSVFDVAAYILQRQGGMPHMKLQRLVYYSQAWHLAWCGETLFRERVEAWANGPVVPVLYEAFLGRWRVDADLLQTQLADPEVRGRVSARLVAEGLPPG